jgi:hypothetical protein
MVRVIGYHENESSEGEKFYSLSIQGGVEMVQSKNTGKFYATARKTRIITTFDELTCQSLIGSEMPGSIQKVECEPYNYTVEDTGEVIELTHTYEYRPDEFESQEAAVLAD